jgi:hypothetical protein
MQIRSRAKPGEEFAKREWSRMSRNVFGNETELGENTSDVEVVDKNLAIA